jgi:hypothetical protein
MQKPTAASYVREIDRNAFRRGVAAARRYLKTFPVDGYSRAIERADARNEPGAWYDGWDTILNPEYFDEI